MLLFPYLDCGNLDFSSEAGMTSMKTRYLNRSLSLYPAPLH